MYYIVLFVVGLLFGSFGSVILHRLWEEVSWKKIRSVLVGRSYCPECKHTLARYDLFPLVSWLISTGRCRYCHKKVSKRYPLLELGNGLMFLWIFYWWTLFGGGDVILLVLFLFVNWTLYLLMIHDIKTMYLHPAVWWLLLAGSVWLFAYGHTIEQMLYAAQWLFVFGIGFFAFYRLAKLYVRLRRKQDAEGLGQGDIMVAPIVGVILRKVYTLMISATALSWLDIIQYFRYYVIVACLCALLLLFVTPITKEGEKRLIPFFPGMIVGIWVMMIGLPYLVAL